MCSKYSFDIEKRPPAKVGVLQKEKVQTTFMVGFPKYRLKKKSALPS